MFLSQVATTLPLEVSIIAPPNEVQKPVDRRMVFCAKNFY
jgi:hypothetical protein